MVYVTGDTHGGVRNFEDGKKLFDGRVDFSQDDYLIITGDFGLVWKDCEDGAWKDEGYAKVFEFFSQFPGKILFIDGNNDNNVALDKFPVESWHGGKVHKMIDPNSGLPTEKMIHLMRGEVFEIENKTILAFGGADSWDARVQARRKKDVNWWTREQPSFEEFSNAMENLKKHNYKVDYIISHDTNVDGVVKYYGWNLPFVTNRFLTAIVETTEFRQWFYDHHHEDVRRGEFETIAHNDFYELTDENYPNFKPKEIINKFPSKELIDDMNSKYRFVEENFVFDASNNSISHKLPEGFYEPRPEY